MAFSTGRLLVVLTVSLTVGSGCAISLKPGAISLKPSAESQYIMDHRPHWDHQYSEDAQGTD